MLFYQSALISRCWQRCGLCSALTLTSCAYSVCTRVYVQQTPYLPPDAAGMLVLSNTDRKRAGFTTEILSRRASMSLLQASITRHAMLGGSRHEAVHEMMRKNCSASRHKAYTSTLIFYTHNLQAHETTPTHTINTLVVKSGYH
jgi:hypothetical protein